MRKNIKQIVSAFCILMLVFCVTNPEIKVYAGQSTQDKIDDAEKEKERLEEEKEKKDDEIDDLRGDTNTIQNKLAGLTKNFEEIGILLDDLNDQILLKEKDIEVASIALEEAQARSEEQYENMVLRVRRMYERNDTNIFNAILSAKSLSELLNAADYFECIERYDQKKLEEFKAQQSAIEDEKKKLEAENVELEELKKQAEEEAEKISELIEDAREQARIYAEQLEAAEAAAREYEEEIAKKEEDLEYLYKVLAEEIERSKKAAQGEWRDISEITFEEGDRYLLANLIYCEAGGEPYEGQVAVGAVVINRVLSGCFPDTVTGVIYQNLQFSPVGSGRLALALAQNKATDSCYKAADEAMKGITNVGNCVYFRTPIEGLEGIRIGGHIFY